ncbi:MAG: hypothetical protein K2R98_08390 [Gemmataceae bacterium]|nr:hypothetical protein [Gemmataceae bacterium]
MRLLWLTVLAAIGLGVCYLVAQAEPPMPPAEKDFALHEWGVITVYNDVDLANADMRAVWNGLPSFVHGQVDSRKLPTELVLVLAPVVYFHTPKDLHVDLKVEFPGGKPALWWPQNSNIARNLDQTMRDKHLEWRLQVGTVQKEVASYLKVPDVPKGHWLEACRQVKCADVVAHGQNGRGSRGGEREKFVYYDGMIPSPKAVQMTVMGERVSVQNNAKHAVLDVTVVDRRTPGKVRVARLPKLDAAADVKALDFQDADMARWPGSAVEESIAQLKASGLFEDEAGAMLAVWKKDLFETEGLTMFYRLPQSEYDRLLPLTVNPRPEKVARTMLVVHPHCEPDLGDKVMKLVKQLDSNRFEERMDAHQRLHALGRAAFVHLLRARQARPSLEVTARLNKLLEEFESERGFGK